MCRQTDTAPSIVILSKTNPRFYHVYCKVGDSGDWWGISGGDHHEYVKQNSSSGSNEIDMGDDDDTSIVKESNGFHIIEVDASNNQGWSWLALKLGLICSSALHYVCLTKQA